MLKLYWIRGTALPSPAWSGRKCTPPQKSGVLLHAFENDWQKEQSSLRSFPRYVCTLQLSC